MIMTYGSREKSIMCFKLHVVCIKSINSVLLSNGRGKNIWCTVTMPALVSSAAVFCSAGRLLSVCLMIYQFYSNEPTQSKCIIWSLITRASVLMFRSGHEPATSNTAVLCTANRQTGKGWVLLDVNHPLQWLIDGNKAVFVFRLKFKKSFDLFFECLAESV